MIRFLISVIGNVTAFFCAMVYGYWWSTNQQHIILLVAVPALFVGIIILGNYLLRKYSPEKMDKYNLNQTLGLMAGQIIGCTFLWFALSFFTHR